MTGALRQNDAAAHKVTLAHLASKGQGRGRGSRGFCAFILRGYRGRRCHCYHSPSLRGDGFHVVGVTCLLGGFMFARLTVLISRAGRALLVLRCGAVRKGIAAVGGVLAGWRSLAALLLGWFS